VERGKLFFTGANCQAFNEQMHATELQKHTTVINISDIYLNKMQHKNIQPLPLPPSPLSWSDMFILQPETVSS